MLKKKIEVVELNKKKERIILEEKQSPLIIFLRKHNFLILLTVLILSLTIIAISLYIAIKNINKSEDPKIKDAILDISLDNYKADLVSGNNSVTENTAKNLFSKKMPFKGDGEVLLIKTIDNDKFMIKYYSDGTSLKINKISNIITRILPLDNGKYGINDNGNINSKAITSDVFVKETKTYPWGTVTFYSDGSAIVNNSKMDIFVRNGKDVHDNYISNNKVTYLKETKKVGNNTLNYYYDGTIEIIKDNKSYLVRTIDDIEIKNDDIIFKNDNEATIYKTIKTKDGMIIDYYTDGGAIIKNNNETLSVRKSNSIIIKNNKIYEIVDNEYVEISRVRDNVTYYTNGSAIVKSNNTTYYIEENSDIKYKNNSISSLPDSKETISNETNNNGENVKIFEKTAVVTTKDYTKIIPSDKVAYDENGKFKDTEADIKDDINNFKITNNTNEKLKYRVVIEESNKTTVDVEYLRYQLSANNEYIGPKKLNDNIWPKDNLYKSLKVKGTNYILIDSSIEPYETKNISIMLWTDYDTIPNSMQNKYFYGTIRVYAWSDK